MTYKEKSVSFDGDEKVLKSVLGDVTVSETGVERSSFKKEEEWDKIVQEMGQEKVFRDFVHWSEVGGIEIYDEHLAFPHIDLMIKKKDGEGKEYQKQVIYFKENDLQGFDEVKRFFNTLKKYWNSFRQDHQKVL